jgi:hypothetical protein
MVKKSAIAIALLGSLYGTSASAVGTGLPWTVDESVVPGSVFNIFTVDSFDFSYKAVIEQANDGGLLNGDPFQEKGFFEVSSYKLGVATVSSQLNCIFTPFCYNMYGVFDISGTATATGGGIRATFTSATLSLYLDPDQNTTKSLPTSDGTFDGIIAGSVTLGGNIEDLLIGTATLLNVGEAHVFPGLANGDFEVVLGNWSLTSFGASYWSAPSPFYFRVNFDGNTTTITGASLTAPFFAKADGSGNAFFIPEPTSLALLGLGLFSLGASRRHSVLKKL